MPTSSSSYIKLGPTDNKVSPFSPYNTSSAARGTHAARPAHTQQSEASSTMSDSGGMEEAAAAAEALTAMKPSASAG